MEKALAEGPGAGTEFPSFSFFSSRVPSGQSLSSPGNRVSGLGPAKEWRAGGVRRRRGWVRWGKGTGNQVGERKLFSLQVQGVSSQVLTHNNSEQGEECGAGKGREKRKAGAVVVLRNQSPRDAWPRAGSAPGFGGRGSGAPR